MSIDAMPLRGDLVRLEPLAEDHIPGLALAAEEDRSAFGYTMVPRAAGTAAYVQAQLAKDEVTPFAQVRVADGAPVGCTAYDNPRTWPGRDDLSAVEIGGTWLAASAQRTGINAESKLLLMTYAFETLNVARVDFRTDARNQRSRRAIERAGARFEGVVRNWGSSWVPGEEGRLRDSAIYSVIAVEWPQVKSALIRRIQRLPDSPRPYSPATPEIIVRDYTESDYGACRSLWAELTEHHRRIYGDSSIGGEDPGAGFDDYLAESRRTGSWVAESRDGVIGLTGLFDRGTSGEVEPVVVAEAARNGGVGRMLISRVVEEARARGYHYLAIRPVARNVGAVRRFHAAGFRALGGHIDLTMDLAARRLVWLHGASLHGLDFDY